MMTLQWLCRTSLQLILALEVSLKQIVAKGMDSRFAAHVAASNRIKDALARLGFKLVPVSRDLAVRPLHLINKP